MWSFISFVSIFAYYLFNMAPSLTVGDAGEFQTASTILGIAHAPGYPLFSLMGKVSQIIFPFGSYAYRVNLLSALCGALTSVIFGICVYIFLKRHFRSASSLLLKVLSFFSSVYIASTLALFRSSVQTEVFTLNSFFASVVIFCVFLLAVDKWRLWYLIFFIIGFAATNHQTIILLLPALLWIFVQNSEDDLPPEDTVSPKDVPPRQYRFSSIRKKLFKPSVLAGLILFFAIGFSLNFYLIIRAHKEPALNVGNPSNLSRFIRVIRRADYGTLKLTVGEKKGYDYKTFVGQCRRVISGAVKELSLPGALASLAGMVLMIKRGGYLRRYGIFLILIYIFAIPFFIFLGNLPFDAESEGILERFYVMGNLPLVFFAVVGVLFLIEKVFNTFNFAIIAAIFITGCFAVYNFSKNFDGCHWRKNFLAYDYGVNLLRSIPVGGALFMDGGDDTFYTTAYLVFAEGRRRDVSLFDRGGIVFNSPYGSDFRSGILTQKEKDLRRRYVESGFAGHRPVAFSTFNKEIMSGVIQRGILYWSPQSENLGQLKGCPSGENYFEFYQNRDFLSQFDDYRSRSLQPLYFYMENSSLISDENSSRDRVLSALDGFDYCLKRWPDVSWLKTNIKVELSQSAYRFFTRQDYFLSRVVYERLLGIDPADASAWTNLGVVYEKSGDDENALSSYQKAIESNPRHALAYYNKAVIYWKKKSWNEVVENFEKVLALEPHNPAAKTYLERAKNELIKKTTK